MIPFIAIIHSNEEEEDFIGLSMMRNYKTELQTQSRSFMTTTAAHNNGWTKQEPFRFVLIYFAQTLN